MQPQAVTENIDAARRDSRLLRMAFRRARQAGDYRGALQASQLGDQMGLQVGTPIHDEAIKGLGMRRYQDKMRMNQIAQSPLGSETGEQSFGGGMSGRNIDPGMTQERNYDIDPGITRQPESSGDPGMVREQFGGGGSMGQQPQLGVGGYDFNQRVGSPLARPQTAAIETTPDQLRRAVMQRRWQTAKTTEEKDAITEQAAAQGLTSNPSAVQDALMRRRKLNGPSETIPLRPNSQLGGPPSGEVMKGYEEYKPGAGGWIRPIKTGLRDIASTGQYIQERQAGRDAIEQDYQKKIAGLESLRPNRAKFQSDLERGYMDSVMAAPFGRNTGVLPPDESMLQTLSKSRGNERKNRFKNLRSIF